MKKILFLSILSLFLLTGCGKSDTITCTGTQDEDTIKVKSEIKAEIKDNKVTNVTAKMEFDDSKAASTMCGIFNLANSMAENDEDKFDYDCKDKTITFKNYLKLLSSEQDKQEFTKDEFIKIMEEAKLTCK